MTVLVVDDDWDARELMTLALERSGFVVRQAENGKEALDLLQDLEPAPCLVLLDMMMPVMSGAELLTRIRATERLASLPVVIVSAHAQINDLGGAQQLLRKPAPPGALVRVAREFCRRDAACGCASP